MHEASPPPLSPSSRGLQAVVIGGLAAAMVIGAAALSGAVFDGLPKYVDVVLVLFVIPFVMLVATLVFYAKVLTPLWPGLLRKSDGHEADLPGLIVGAVLAASIAGIYPGMFPGRTYANLMVRGAEVDVLPQEADTGAAYYRFRDSELRPELSGSRFHTVIRRTNEVTRRIRQWTHAAAIVPSRWAPGDPVIAWAVTDGELPPRWGEMPRLLQGARPFDARDHALRAVRSIAAEHQVDVPRRPILVELGESYDDLLRRSRRRTWMALAPMSLLVFALVGARTWTVLAPTPPRNHG